MGLESDIQGAVKRESLVVAALAQLQREEDEAGHVGYTAEETKADTAQDGVGSHQLARVTDCLQLESSGHGAAQEGFDRATAPCSAQEVPAKDSSQEPDRMAGHPGVGSNHWDETASYTEETSLEDAFRKLDLQSYQSAAANGGAASECEPALGDGEDVVADVDAANDSHRRVPTCTRTNSTDSQCATFSAGAAAAAALHHSLLSSPLAFKDAKVRHQMPAGMLGARKFASLRVRCTGRALSHDTLAWDTCLTSVADAHTRVYVCLYVVMCVYMW